MPQLLGGTLRKLFRPSHGGDRGVGLSLAQRGDYLVAYRGGSADEKVLAHSFENDVFFRAIPEYSPQATDVILDVGAHIGTFALLAARAVPRGVVFALEPSAESYNYLRVNVAVNAVPNVRPVRLALSDTNGETTLHHSSSGNWGHSLLSSRGRGGETVVTSTLDDFLRDNEIQRVGLAKFNCEGAEFGILCTADVDVLQRFRALLVCYHEDIAVGRARDELESKLADCGFELRTVTTSRWRGRIIAVRNTEM